MVCDPLIIIIYVIGIYIQILYIKLKKRIYRRTRRKSLGPKRKKRKKKDIKKKKIISFEVIAYT